MPSQPANPMSTAPPSSHFGFPMQHVGLDLFSFGGKDYLICVDHWSGYPLYQLLRSTTSEEMCVFGGRRGFHAVRVAECASCRRIQSLTADVWQESADLSAIFAYTESTHRFCQGSRIQRFCTFPFKSRSRPIEAIFISCPAGASSRFQVGCLGSRGSCCFHVTRQAFLHN